jgi:hypothetical protein
MNANREKLDYNEKNHQETDPAFIYFLLISGHITSPCASLKNDSYSFHRHVLFSLLISTA